MQLDIFGSDDLIVSFSFLVPLVHFSTCCSSGIFPPLVLEIFFFFFFSRSIGVFVLLQLFFSVHSSMYINVTECSLLCSSLLDVLSIFIHHWVSVLSFHACGAIITVKSNVLRFVSFCGNEEKRAAEWSLSLTESSEFFLHENSTDCLKPRPTRTPISICFLISFAGSDEACCSVDRCPR